MSFMMRVLIDQEMSDHQSENQSILMKKKKSKNLFDLSIYITMNMCIIIFF
jgi:hypothetical protein